MNLFCFNIVLSGMKGGGMQDISDLIKEAKPLYFARKKRNNRIKAGLATLACVFLVFAFIPQKQTSDLYYYWDLGYVDSANSLSYVENLGLPVDDYGLLLVG